MELVKNLHSNMIIAIEANLKPTLCRVTAVNPHQLPASNRRVSSASLMKFLSFVLLVLAGSSIPGPLLGYEVENEGGSCHLREMELCCVSSASIFQNPNGIPISGPEFKRQCEYLDESADCYKSYGERCLTKHQHQLVDLFMGELFEIEKDFCNNGTEMRKQYSKNVNCLRSVQKKYQRECVADFQVALEPIHKIEVGVRQPTGCCAMNRFKDCILTKIEDECGNEAVEFVQGILTRGFGNVLNILCRDYDPDTESCKRLLPKTGTIPYNGRNTSAISRVISSYIGVNMNLS